MLCVSNGLGLVARRAKNPAWETFVQKILLDRVNPKCCLTPEKQVDGRARMPLRSSLIGGVALFAIGMAPTLVPLSGGPGLVMARSGLLALVRHRRQRYACQL